MNPIARIKPVSDAEAGQLAGPGTLADLGSRIASTSAEAGQRRVRSRPGRARRRLLIGVPVAAALAVAALAATSLATPGQKLGPVSVGPAKADAAVMSITRHGRYLDVIVTNPLADARKYRAEFAKYGLNLSLKLVPASPSLVGTLVAESTSSSQAGNELKPITAVGKCFTGGGGSVCPVGVRVPLNFSGWASLYFGRAARPGEQYETSAPATAPGEAMHGLSYDGKTVAQVLAMLRRRHVTVPSYRVSTSPCDTAARHTVPGTWYVYSAVPWAPGQVLLWASKSWPLSALNSCTQPGQPVPAPTSSAG
jgi:hypothetical protein